jgi:uncharacterized protein YhjY with autotransporter beta-barrel domain
LVGASNAIGSTSQLTAFTISSGTLRSQDVAVSVTLNTPTNIDLGTATGNVAGAVLRILNDPQHGGVRVSGTVATYIPVADYFGADAFTYVAQTSAGQSAPAVISITVEGRPDPTTNAQTRSLVRSQMDIAKRMSRSQISNFQRRLESLHSRRNRPTASQQARVTPTTDRNDAENYAGGGAGDSAGAQLPATGATLPFFSNLVNAASTGSLDLSNNLGAAASWLPSDMGVWVAGNVKFGTRDAVDNASALRFTTDGVSAGVDRWFSDTLVVGLGMGFATATTDIGSDGTKNETEAWSVSTYASYQPVAAVFVDTLLGYSTLDYALDRYVPAFDQMAHSDRDGDQLFGSIGVSYEYSLERLLIAPYGRFDFTMTWLDRSSEFGAGQNALTYFSDSLESGQLGLGVRVESAHEMNFGWVIPRLRLEYKHEFEGERRSALAYSDQLAGSRFWLVSADADSSALLVSVGSDFEFNSGLKLGIDYQSVQAAGADQIQGFGLWLSQDFDGGAAPWSGLARRVWRNPVRVEAAFSWDDNLNRARAGPDKLADKIYDISVTQRFAVPVASHLRLLLTPSLSGQKFHTHDGLDRLSGALRGELQYRTSGDFYAPTFGVFARLTGEEYSSELRGGYNHAYGVNAHIALSERISAFGTVERTLREADSIVFDTEDYAVRLTFDYNLGRWGSLYAGGEFRRGDTVTSIDSGSAFYDGLSDIEEIDDAYYNQTLEAIRFDAKTWLLRLGYNLPLGPRDSLDFSYRRVRSTPTRGGGSYEGNRLSAAYLMRF